jgi:EAL and modified HD-GYP domain-containing signal transduction protein
MLAHPLPAREPAPSAPAHLLRSSVYDSDLRLAGHAFTAVASGEAPTDADDAAAAVADLLTAKPGLSHPEASIFVRLPRPFLTGRRTLPTVAAPDRARLVLEVAEADLDAPDAARELQALAAAGYRLGLVGTTWSPGLRPLLPLFSVARIDVRSVGTAGLATLVARLGPAIELLVDNVETLVALEACRRHHVSLLAGSLVSRPPVVADGALSASQLACLRLMTALVRADVDLGEVELAVRSDPALTLRVLRAVNSAAGARHRVSSIRQAVVLLGPRSMLGCVLAAGLAQGGTAGSPEAIETVLVRARMCELLAAAVDGIGGDSLDGSAAFTVGLVASLDALLGASLTDIVGELPVDESVEQAVLNQAGPLGRVLADVLAYEQLEAPRLLPVAELRALFLASLAFAAPLVGPPTS